MAPGVRGTARDGKHREDPAAAPAPEPLIVVGLSGETLNDALKKIEDGLLGCVDQAVEKRDDAALIRLHVHLSKIGNRSAKGAGTKPRSAVLTRAQAREVDRHFSGDQPGS